MGKSKKNIIKISLIVLMTICITGSVYATLKCNINMKTEKSEYNKGDTFVVDVMISNIESDRGVISFGGTLEYDKESLKLEKIEGLNGWETPVEGISYNEANGKFVITRNGLGKSDETIFKLTFSVKNTSKQNATVTLKDMTIADGTAPAKVSEISKSITIKEETQKPIPNPGEDTNNNQKPGDGSNNNNNQKPGNNSDTNNNVSKGDNTVTNQKIPQTGEKNLMIPILIGMVTIVGIIFLIKIKRIKE